MSDEIRLTLPAEADFHGVAHLVLGGLGARRALTFEQLEDLQVAFDTVLSRRDDGGEIVITVQVGGPGVRSEIGPFAAGALDDLDGDGASLGLRRVLETVCDSFEVEERDGGSWVQLFKRTEAATV